MSRRSLWWKGRESENLTEIETNILANRVRQRKREIQCYTRSGLQKQGRTWHIVPRNYSSKVGLIHLNEERNLENEGKEEKEKVKMIDRAEGLISFSVDVGTRCSSGS